VTCQEFQDQIPAAVDAVLSTGESAAFMEHAALCEPCRRDYQLELATKRLVHDHMRMVKTPGPVAAAILDSLRLQAAQSRSTITSQLSTWKIPLAVTGVAVACVAATVLLFRGAPEGRDEADRILPGDVWQQSRQNFRAVQAGLIVPQVSSNDAEDVREFLARWAPFQVIVPSPARATVMGGVANEFGGVRLAHVLFNHANHTVYLYQACWTTVCTGDQLTIPEHVRLALDHTGECVEETPEGMTTIAWTRGSTLCIAVANTSKDELYTCLRNERLVPAEGR
jgi:hypothetical protein